MGSLGSRGRFVLLCLGSWTTNTIPMVSLGCRGRFALLCFDFPTTNASSNCYVRIRHLGTRVQDVKTFSLYRFIAI